jgi:hypothetical protein
VQGKEARRTLMVEYYHPMGQFLIPRTYIVRDWTKLLPLFSRMVVIKCQFDYARDSFLYEALAKDFEPIPMGEIPPEYEVIIETDRRGEIAGYTFLRKDRSSG